MPVEEKPASRSSLATIIATAAVGGYLTPARDAPAAAPIAPAPAPAPAVAPAAAPAAAPGAAPVPVVDPEPVFARGFEHEHEHEHERGHDDDD